VAAQSRTPTVAALYGARRQGSSAETALGEVTSVLPNAYPNSDFRRALQRLAPESSSGNATRTKTGHPAGQAQDSRPPSCAKWIFGSATDCQWPRLAWAGSSPIHREEDHDHLP
jgi:hypothetical protein